MRISGNILRRTAMASSLICSSVWRSTRYAFCETTVAKNMCHCLMKPGTSRDCHTGSQPRVVGSA